MTCARLAWAPGLGDRDGLGLALTLAYAAATLMVAAVALRGPALGPDPGSERRLWGLAAGVLLLLTLNKQLDLQNFVTATGRCVSREQGWYDLRRTYQREAVVALIVFAALALTVAVLVFRHSMRGSRLLVAGMVGLVFFVLIRAVSFHHMDSLLGTRLLSLRLHRAIEATALGLVLIAGAARLLRPRT